MMISIEWVSRVNQSGWLGNKFMNIVKLEFEKFPVKNSSGNCSSEHAGMKERPMIQPHRNFSYMTKIVIKKISPVDYNY